MARYSRIVKKRRKNVRRLPFIPESAQAFVARRIMDGCGVFLLLGSAFVTLSIISYNHADPSWNTATQPEPGTIYNWMGNPGAYLSDFLLQTLGAGCLAFVLVFAIWGVRILQRHILKPLILRFSMLILAVLAAATAFARIPSGEWLVTPYLGGSGGTIILNKFAALLPGMENAHTSMALLSAAIALLTLLYAVAIQNHEWKTFFNVIWHGIKYASRKLLSAVIFFYEWTRYYNDPARQKNEGRQKSGIKLKKIKAVKRTKTAGIAPDVSVYSVGPALPEQTETVPNSSLSSIRVISPNSKKGITKKTKTTQTQTSFPLSENAGWELPPLDMLQVAPAEQLEEQLDEKALQQNAELLQNVLADFKIEGEIVSIHPGPVVTLYELEPAPGVKAARVISLSDDIARSMAAISVRCAVISGRNVIGIEMPNKRRQTVYLRQLLETREARKNTAQLPLILGKDISGDPIIADLARMPHLLVAGTTGSGKSVAVNTMILSLLYHLPPEKCRLIMIDPKMLELSVYDDIPHLLSPVVTDPGKAIMALKWAVQEMENRYRSMSKLGVRNIEGYNNRLCEAIKKGETLMRKVQTGFDTETGKPIYEEQPMDMTELPYIVIIVDEFADLMLVAGKDVESAIQRLAQMARAAGIHLIMATQRPSVDVITGVIKANFPTRISFQVTSKIDSRTILGEGGAEQLLGMGDMLYMAPGGRITRVHGPFVSDEDVENVVSHLKAQGEPSYVDDVTIGGDFGDSTIMNAMFGDGDDKSNKVDELYDEAVALIAREGKASTSFIQRYLQIGYNRAARIIEEMERQGVVSKASPTGKRDVLVSDFSDA